MSVLAAILAKLWAHSRADALGWREKVAMIVIAALIVRAVIRFQAGMVR